MTAIARASRCWCRASFSIFAAISPIFRCCPESSRPIGRSPTRDGYFGLEAAEIVGLQVKFKRPIGPEQRIQLDLAFARERARLSFEYRDGSTICSSGVISLSDA